MHFFFTRKWLNEAFFQNVLYLFHTFTFWYTKNVQWAWKNSGLFVYLLLNQHLRNLQEMWCCVWNYASILCVVCVCFHNLHKDVLICNIWLNYLTLILLILFVLFLGGVIFWWVVVHCNPTFRKNKPTTNKKNQTFGCGAVYHCF